MSQPNLKVKLYAVAPADGSQAPGNVHQLKLRPCGTDQPVDQTPGLGGESGL